MDPDHEASGEHLIESETSLQAESSTLAGMGPRSLTPSLELVMLLVPVSREAACVAPFLHAIETQVEPPFGVMLVYEAGDDATLAVATEFARTRPWLDLLPNTSSPGRAGALRTGFQAIGQGPAVVMSVSGSDDPNDVTRMRRLYAEGHPIVAASRDMRGGHRRGGTRLSRRLGRWANRLIRKFARLPLQDPTNSFRLYEASLVNNLGIDSTSDSDVPLELAAKAYARGLSIIEIPTTWTDRSGRSTPRAVLSAPRRWLRWCRMARRRTAQAPLTPPSAVLSTMADSQTLDSQTSSPDGE